MKTMKKFASLFLALLMIFAMTVTASANTTTYTITVNNSAEGHTYEAYQIFTGDLSGAADSDEATGTNAVLANIVWGEGVTYTGDGVTVENAAGETVQSTAAADLAAALAAGTLKLDAFIADLTLTAPSASTGTVTDGKYVISGLKAGYYLVKDQTGSLTGDDDSYTSYIIEVVENSVIAPKSAKPTVDKQVWDEATDDDDHTQGDENWGETADHNLNESFQFKLIGTLPADDDFAAYSTYTVVFNDTMSAGITYESIASVKVNGTDVAEADYVCTAAAEQAGGSWTLTIADITKYDTDLTDGAKIEVIYNAHLNTAAGINNVDTNKNTVFLQYSNNPYVTTELGQTASDTVWVFTYELDAIKKDGKTDNALAQAEFVLYRQIKTVEGQTEPVKEYVVLDENGYVTGWTETKPATATLISAVDGTFKIIGLDHGTYQLEEIKAPDGYNLLADPVEVVIEAVHAEDANTTTAATTITGNGAATITVINNAGATLPETGGIGTTIFYAVGGVLVLAAVVLLVTKKRMNREG